LRNNKAGLFFVRPRGKLLWNWPYKDVQYLPPVMYQPANIQEVQYSQQLSKYKH
jgi:hypothetical protein